MVKADSSELHPTLRSLKALWSGKAKDRLPTRDSLAPAEMMPLLPNLMMIRLDPLPSSGPSGRNAIVEWTGTAVREAAGTLADKPLSQAAFMDERSRETLKQAITGTDAWSGGTLKSPEGKPYGFHFLVLPLADDDGDVVALLAGLVVWPQEGSD